MKPKRALLFTATVVLILCAACGVWLHEERQQYARNRALIDALLHNDTKTALALVNAGADPNTRFEPTPAPTLPQLLQQLLRHTPPPVNGSPTAFNMACASFWPIKMDGADRWITLDEEPPLIQAMLAHGANVNARLSDKRTALHDAVAHDRLHTVELLLQHGADVNAQDAQGTSPLMLTFASRTSQVAHLLLLHGANPNAQTAGGFTALYNAMLNSTNNGLVAELLLHGADPNLSDKNGLTPLQWAHKNKRPDLVRLMEQGRRR